jgi:phosphatidylglycerophosphate synthase
MHPFLLLVCFNVFSQSANPYLIMASSWWGKLLTFSSPLFIAMEGLSSLLVVQKLGQEGKRLVGEGEAYQFGLLIATAVTYVVSAWWIVIVSPPLRKFTFNLH